MRPLLLLILLVGSSTVELRFSQPMRAERTVTVVARGVAAGTLRLFTIAGREVAATRFTTDAGGTARWRLPAHGLSSGAYLLRAEWEGGRLTRLVLLVH